jgi:hypothetical protein
MSFYDDYSKELEKKQARASFFDEAGFYHATVIAAGIYEARSGGLWAYLDMDVDGDLKRVQWDVSQNRKGAPATPRAKVGMAMHAEALMSMVPGLRLTEKAVNNYFPEGFDRTDSPLAGFKITVKVIMKEVGDKTFYNAYIGLDKKVEAGGSTPGPDSEIPF